MKHYNTVVIWGLLGKAVITPPSPESTLELKLHRPWRNTSTIKTSESIHLFHHWSDRYHRRMDNAYLYTLQV